jgi:asparagine synthase (glutamine-hydrolysing)
MFFSAYLGSPAQELKWRENLGRHAAWLGLSAHAFFRGVADGRVFAFGWVSLRPPDTDALVREDGDLLTVIPLNTLTRAEALAQGRPRGFVTNAIRMDVSLTSGEIRVAVPIVTVEQFYWAGDARAWVFGNDLRLMLRWAGLELDERAVYGFFQYDYIPPPLTISKTVRRIPGGFALALPSAGEPSLAQVFDARELAVPHPESISPAEQVRVALDGLLSRVPPSPVVHFSGGVDSGLIAARLAALGRRDARLQHFSSGPNDPFRDVAPQMAANLGLPSEQVEWQTSDVPAALGDLAKEYSFPMCDPAALPTLTLLHAMDRWAELPSMLVTGTAGGNVFNVGVRYETWRRIGAIPKPLRSLGARAYTLGLWKSNAKVARATVAMQKSVQFSVLQAAGGAISHGTLVDLAYTIPPEVRADIERLLAEKYEAVTEGADPRDRIALMSMMRHSACLCGARPFDAMRKRGIPTVHAYAEPAMVRAGFSLSWEEKCEKGVLKSVLKRLLAESVPTEWAYHARSGFLLPFSDVFSHPGVRAIVRDEVLSPRNPVMAFCRPRGVEKVFRRAEAGQPMNPGARRFVWALTSLSLWLSQLETEHP